jgi:hypothetical protein
MPRVALPDSCSYAGYLGVSTVHTFKIYIFSWLHQQRFFISQLQLRHNRQLLHSTHIFKDLAGYPLILGIVDLRPLRGRHAYKGLPEVGPARLLAAMLRRFGCLYTSFDQDHDSVFISFLSIKPAMLPASMLEDYSTSASPTPSWFPHHTDLLGNSTYFFFSFLDHHTGHPARHDARILLYECILDAL